MIWTSRRSFAARPKKRRVTAEPDRVTIRRLCVVRPSLRLDRVVSLVGPGLTPPGVNPGTLYNSQRETVNPFNAPLLNPFHSSWRSATAHATRVLATLRTSSSKRRSSGSPSALTELSPAWNSRAPVVFAICATFIAVIPPPGMTTMRVEAVSTRFVRQPTPACALAAPPEVKIRTAPV